MVQKLFKCARWSFVHKTANVLDKLPKRLQSGAKQKIHTGPILGPMYRAATKQDALAAFDDFMALYEEKCPKACACLRRDKEVLFTFYDFPAAH